MTVAFSINGSTPPAYAAPSSPSSRGVIHPPSTGLDGNGRPKLAVGSLEAEVGRNVISDAGHSWWMAHFSGSPDATYVNVTNVVIYDPVRRAERTFATGVMHRPTWDEYRPGAAWLGLRVRFSNLVPA